MAIILSSAIVASVPLHADDILSGPDGAWRFLDTSPNKRAFPLCAYDPASDRMFIFGGRTAYSSWTGDSWWLTLRGVPEWSHLATSASGPGWGGAHIFDSARNRVVSFGGIYSNYSNTTWSHAFGASVAWTQQIASGTIPSPRAWTTGIYDSARDRMVMFGGEGRVGTTTVVYENDVHSLDFPSNAWGEIAVLGTPPTPRSEHSAIYDPVRDRMVVFGGKNASTTSNELWILDFSPTPQWTLVSPVGPAPSARSDAATIYDPARDRMVIFGGSGLNDTWTLSLSDLSWTQLATESAPSGRTGAGATLDPVGDRMIVFAGETAEGGNDTWALSLSGTPTWTLLHVGRPGTRTGHSAIRVPSTDQMIVFGGVGYGSFGPATYYNDVLALELGTSNWVQLTPAGTPPSARSSPAVFDPGNNRMLVFGGGLLSTYLDELWSLSLAGTPEWTLLSPTGSSPGQRAGHSAILDPVRNRMLVYGGNTLYGGSTDDKVYALSLTGSLSWEQLTVGGASPGSQSGHTAIYDPVRDRMVLFGGLNSKTWALSLGGSPMWTQLATSGTPPTDGACTGIYDSLRDRLVIYGGGYIYQGSRTFALSLSEPPTWTELAPAGPFHDGRSGAVGIYDPLRDRMVIHGGQYDGGTTTHYTHDTAYELVWGDIVSVPMPTATGSGATLRLVRPNPGGGSQAFEIELATDLTEGNLDVFAVTGQRVWSRGLRKLGSGRHVIDWNGRRDDGRQVAPGVYLARVRTGTSASSRRFVRID